MTAFEKYKARARRRFLERVPEESRELVRHYLAQSDLLNGMPDAELTPDLLALQKKEREYTAKGFEAFVQRGRMFQELRTRFATDAEFWQFVEEETKTGRTEVLDAMEAAREQQS